MAEFAANNLGSAEVAIRVSMDQLDRGLAAARNRLSQFDNDTSKSKGTLAALEAITLRTAEAVEELTANLSRQHAAATQQQQALDKSVDSVNRLSSSSKAANDNLASANDNFKESGKAAFETAKGFASGALEVYKWIGFITLGTKVAKAASPAFAGMLEKFSPGVNQATSALTKYVPAVGTAVAATKPFRSILDGLEILQLAKHFTLAGAAAYAFSPAVRQVANAEVIHGIKAIPEAIGTIVPAAKGAGGVLSSVLGPGISFIARLAVPLIAVAAAVKTVGALFEIGQKKAAELTDTLTKSAAAVGVSREFFERYSKSADAFKVSTEDATNALKKFREINTPDLGGSSSFKDTLKELQEAGNFANNAGAAAFQSATNTEERYRAVVKLITEASEKGERLAALELAKTFLPAEMVDRLRSTGDLLASIQSRADKISQTQLMNQGQVQWALQLKGSLDASTKILEDWWKAKIPGIEEAGLVVFSVWVKIVEKVAQGVVAADAFIKLQWENVVKGVGDTRKELEHIYTILGQIGALGVVRALANDFMEGARALADMGRRAAGLNTQTVNTGGKGNLFDKQDVAATKEFTDAQTRLALSMREPLAATRQMEEALDHYRLSGIKAFQDVSKEIQGATTQYTRLLEQTQRHITDMKSQAQTVGQSAGAIERLTTANRLLEAAAKAGKDGVDEELKKIKELSEAAGRAAQALADSRQAFERKSQDLQNDQSTRALTLQRDTIDSMSEAQDRLRGRQEARFRVEQEALQAGRLVNASDEARIDQLEAVADETARLNAEIRRGQQLADTRFEQKTTGLSADDVEIATKLRGQFESVEKSLASSDAALMRFVKNTRRLGDDLGDFMNTFVDGVLRGQTAVEALSSALSNLGSSITRSALKDLGSSIAGSFSKEGGIGSTIASALGAAGSFGGPIGSLVGAAAGVGVSLISKLFGGDKNDEAKKAQEQAQQQAVQNFQSAQDALAGVVDQFRQLAEVAKGPLTTSVRGAQEQLKGLTRAAEAQKTSASILGSTFGAGTPQAAAAAQAFQEANEAIWDAERTMRTFGERTIQSGREALRGTEALTEVGQTLKDLRDQAGDLAEAMTSLGASTQQAADTVNSDLAVAIDHLRTNFIDKLNADINEATGKGFINQISELIKSIQDAAAIGNVDPELVSRFLSAKAQEIVDSTQLTGKAFDDLLTQFPELTGKVHAFALSMEDVAARTSALNDRLFNALTDQTTLDGRLAAFARDADRQREEEQRLGGANAVLLEETLMAERINIIDDFTKAATEAERQGAQQREDAINQSVKNIVDYVNGLFSGTGSTLAPLDRLGAAQSTYAATLQLAQQGNIDAMNRITTDAEALRTSLRDVFGSTLEYQQGVQSIASDLLGLPAVQETTDPVVQAIRDNIIATEAIVPAVNSNTSSTATSLNTVNTTASGTTSAVNDVETQAALQKGVLDIINATTQAQKTAQDTANSLATSANSLANSANSFLDQMKNLLDSINNLQSTANASLATQNAQLDALNNQFSHTPIFEPFVGSVDNNMLDALNKIVINTAEIVGNTARTAISVSNADVHGALTTAGVSFAYHVAEGGWVKGGTANKDSVPLLAMPGEYVVKKEAAQVWGRFLELINSGRTPSLPTLPFSNVGSSFANDNLVREIRGLRDEITRMSQDGTRAQVAGAEWVREGIDGVSDALSSIAREQKIRSVTPNTSGIAA